MGRAEDARKRLMSQYTCLSAFPENLGALISINRELAAGLLGRA